jgi:tetratricopeptide (TPR) repeat protein
LAVLYSHQGKYGDALPLYKRSLAIRERILGPNHPEVAGSLNNLANLYYKQGRYVDALPLNLRAVRIAEVALEPGDPNIKIFRRNLEICQNAMR